jgi:hypothetical protein
MVDDVLEHSDVAVLRAEIEIGAAEGDVAILAIGSSAVA